jgi:hypothetical protein
MVVYALGILILLGEGITRLEKLIGRLIVRGCKAIWRFIRKLINKQGDVVLEESKVEV